MAICANKQNFQSIIYIPQAHFLIFIKAFAAKTKKICTFVRNLTKQSLMDNIFMQQNKIQLVVFLSILTIAGACRRETKEEQIRRIFAEFTQQECPKFVDPFTCLDSVGYDIEGNTLSYHYTVRDTLDDESIYTEELIEFFYDNTLKELKNSIPMKNYKEMGITFHYDYHSLSTGKMLMELTYTSEDYANTYTGAARHTDKD